MLQNLLLPFLLALAPLPQGPDAPPSRALMHALCEQPRLAGTLTAGRATEFVAETLEAAGWQVIRDEREVLLSLPRRLSVNVVHPEQQGRQVLARLWTFDPDAIPAGDIPPFSAWSASGKVRGPLLDAGYGMREDFERLKAAGVDPRGSVALIRYGRCYRGLKVALAEEYGCAAVLLFSAPKDDGPGKGRTWPQGPWKPATSAQRGSIGDLSRAPGDPSTPGYPSPAPGSAVQGGKTRLSDFELAQALPKIPCLPIGSADAELLLGNLARRRMEQGDAGRTEAIGPGPLVATVEVQAPRELRKITNIIGRMQGTTGGAIMAGNHRDAWVRGAQDAGSGTVSLLRAAQILGEAQKGGWTPKDSIFVAFWDAEEFGLIGSTEWVESNEAVLSQALHLYINADALVSGMRLSASGCPGLEGFLADTLDKMALPSEFQGTRPSWRDSGGAPRALGLPGSGSDFASFLHHLGLPVLDLSFQGNSGGQYHTEFDDVAMLEKYLDPGYKGHELAAHTLAALLREGAMRGPGVLDEVRAAQEMARHAGEAKEWMGLRQAQGIQNALLSLADTIAAVRASKLPGVATPPQIYQSLLRSEGLPRKPWLRNALWSPDPATGYGSVTYPVMRIAIEAKSQGALDFEVSRLINEIQNLKNAWNLVPRRPDSGQ
ncbi:MAG: M28 family peptidase [Planctomycetota bacterium]